MMNLTETPLRPDAQPRLRRDLSGVSDVFLFALDVLLQGIETTLEWTAAVVACTMSAAGTGLWRAMLGFVPILIVVAILAPSPHLLKTPMTSLALADLVPRFDLVVPPTADQLRRDRADEQRQCEADRSAAAGSGEAIFDCSSRPAIVPTEILVPAPKAGLIYIVEPSAYFELVFMLLALISASWTFTRTFADYLRRP